VEASSAQKRAGSVSPAHDQLASLTDAELEFELKLARHDRARHPKRYDSLVAELLTRHRGYRTRTTSGPQA